VGALIAERGIAQRSWSDALAIGKGAATGRLVATVVKAIMAAAVGVLLTAAALIH
jgi:hypothetical protein